jgi:integrase
MTSAADHIPELEAKYIDEGRTVFRALFPTGDFDASSWDMRHLWVSRHKSTNTRVYLTKYGSTVEPLPPRFAQIVKAYLVLAPSSAGTMVRRADGARMLWKALESRHGNNPALFKWEDVSEDDLLQTEQQMLLHWGKGATYKQFVTLQRMLQVLAAAPYGPILKPISITPRTPRQEDFERYTLEGRALRQNKMPSDGAICAVGDLFNDLVTEPHERLIVCALAILLATGFRVGEALTLPLDCEVSEGHGMDCRYGLRFYKEKSPGGEKQLAVRWMTPNQAELAQAAIEEVRKLTNAARDRARILESRPDTVLLPEKVSDVQLSAEKVGQLLGWRSSVEHIRYVLKKAKVRVYESSHAPNNTSSYYRAEDVMTYLRSIRSPLWVVDRRNGSFQMLSQSLFIHFRNAGHAGRPVNSLLVELLNEQAINDFLGGRVYNGRAVVKSAFEKYGIRDANGEFFSMRSPQFRHWVTTKAAQAGVPDHVIARWQGREHIGDLQAYKHLSPDDRLSALRSALKSGRVKGQISQMYFSLAEDVRDVFLEGQLQAVHVTPLGLCVHDFKVTPCPKFLNCVKDCEDYILDTANKKHINNMVQLKIRTELALDQAFQQRAKGEGDLSENWIAEAEATLNGVQRILDAASLDPTTALRPFKGKGSNFEAVDSKIA